MNVYLNSKELIHDERFIIEPADKYGRDLQENSSSKIILNSGRGTGKSVILNNMENRNIGTNEPVIYTHFDSIVNFSRVPNKLFNEIFFEHYYEINFSWKLLNHIKKYYGLTYENYFKDIELLLKKITEEFDKNVRRTYVDELVINNPLSTTQISAEIIERLKKYLDISSLILAIDRFDWTNGRSNYTQQILSKYFDMFNKVIITSDDESLIDEKKRKSFEAKGYSFVSQNYGNDLAVIKSIIKKRVQVYNSMNSDCQFNIDDVTDVIYENLIKDSNGNISTMLTTIYEVINLSKWENGNVNLLDLFQKCLEEQNNHIKELKKISVPPKLHL